MHTPSKIKPQVRMGEGVKFSTDSGYWVCTNADGLLSLSKTYAATNCEFQLLDMGKLDKVKDKDTSWLPWNSEIMHITQSKIIGGRTFKLLLGLTSRHNIKPAGDVAFNQKCPAMPESHRRFPDTDPKTLYDVIGHRGDIFNIPNIAYYYMPCSCASFFIKKV